VTLPSCGRCDVVCCDVCAESSVVECAPAGACLEQASSSGEDEEEEGSDAEGSLGRKAGGEDGGDSAEYGSEAADDEQEGGEGGFVLFGSF